MALSQHSKFSARRKEPVLVTPAEPTPSELLLLSEIDDQDTLRFHIPGILFYRADRSGDHGDPAQVIRDAISKALVEYYPLAGRMRELDGRKLAVECTGDGIMFVEADADVTLDQLVDICGGQLCPPFPFLDEVLHDPEGYGTICDSPLMLIQVTRLACGGFICALKMNHTLSDGAGMSMFMNAVSDFARGATVVIPTRFKPVWCRELLRGRDPPRVTCAHPHYGPMPASKSAADVEAGGVFVFNDEMAHRSFFFGPKELARLRNRLLQSDYLRQCSPFDLITACLWRSRTAALEVHPEDDVRVNCIVNARQRLTPPLPAGYYGNAFVYSPATTTAGELCSNPLSYAVELVKNAKAAVTDEYVRSFVDMLVVKGRPHVTVERSYVVSDLTRARFDLADFGWGLPVYGGPSFADYRCTFYVPVISGIEEAGIMVPVCLPTAAMERFAVEFEKMVMEDPGLAALNGV